jgi:penicillin-binding protein 2
LIMKAVKSQAQSASYPVMSLILGNIFLLGLVVIVGTLFFYQIIKGDYYSKRAKNNYVRAMPTRALRGSIFDRNGITLALDRASFNISVVPYQVSTKREALFDKISSLLPLTSLELEKNYTKNIRGHFAPVDIIINIDKTAAIRLKEELGDDVVINPQPIRHYPNPFAAAHLTGYVKEAQSFYERLKQYGYTPLERAGFLGVEQYYDAYLRGEDGGDLIEIDAKGNAVGFLGKRLPKKGKDIYLTIDIDLNNLAKNIMGKKRGAIILIDSKNGEVVTLYSSPSFNPNAVVSGRGTQEFLSDPNSPLLNRAIQTTYPMGSTFKPIVAVAGLEEKISTAHTSFVCEGELYLGSTRFKCLHHHGNQNLYQAIANSCNVYFYNLSLLLGPDKISYWAKQFHLDSPTGIDLPYEKNGFIPTVEWKKRKHKQPWYAGDTLNLSIGQGYISATTIALTTAMNAIANNGYLITPHILKQVGKTPSNLSTKTYLRLDEQNLAIIRRAMRETVRSPEGTAHLLEKLDLRLAGKTGTAQTNKESHGWFVGFFPYENPKYTICVFLENIGSSYYAVEATHSFLEKAHQEGLL